MTRPLRAFVALAALLAASLAAPAGPIADLLWWESPLFTVEDANAFDAAARLSPEQRRAVEDLLLAGMTDSAKDGQRRWIEMRERVSELSFEAQLVQSEERRARQAGIRLLRNAAFFQSVDIEKRTLQDVRSLLTPAQDQSGWPALERFRVRRAALELSGNEGRTASPLRDLARKARLADADFALLEPVIDDLETTLDQLAEEQVAAFRESQAEAIANLRREAAGEITDRRTPGAPPTKAQERARKADRAVFAAVTRACIRAAEILPDASRAKLNRARAPDALAMLGLSYDPITASTITADWRCQDSLTPDQRRAIDDLAKAAWQQHLDMGVAELKWYDDAAIAGTGWNTDAPLARWGDKSRAIMDKLRADALALLTPAQRARANSFVESRQEIEAAFDAPTRRQR